MANKTSIEWCDFSSNPIRYRHRETGRDVWACAKVSPGCTHCYSEALALRFGKAEPYLDEKEVKKLLDSKKLAGRRVFIGDMTDIFGAWVPDELLDRLFAAFALRPDVMFQVLTKRAERMADYITSRGKASQAAAIEAGARSLGWTLEFHGHSLFQWPLENCWLGVSVEDQQRADERIPHLLATPAAVRFLSVEPLLEPIDLALWLTHSPERATERRAKGGNYQRQFLDWIIVGGESGQGARPLELEWVASIVAQCNDAGVPCFIKQLGHAPRFTDFGINQRYSLLDSKGGDITEWPAALRVREFPR